MNRREVLSLLGTTALGLGVVGAPVALVAEDKGGHKGHSELSRKCAEACSDCVRECNESFHHSYE